MGQARDLGRTAEPGHRDVVADLVARARAAMAALEAVGADWAKHGR